MSQEMFFKNRLLWSSVVYGKPLFPKCYMTFWNMTIWRDTLH